MVCELATVDFLHTSLLCGVSAVSKFNERYKVQIVRAVWGSGLLALPPEISTGVLVCLMFYSAGFANGG